MENWQKSRNYRRIKDADGNIIANIITVEGVDVAVTEELFLAYSQMDRRERYVSEDSSKDKLLSLDQLAENHIQLESIGAEAIPSVEDNLLEKEEASIWEERLKLLRPALSILSDRDQDLIAALFFDNVSTRTYASRIGVTQRAVIKRRDRILRDVKKFFKESAN